MDSAFAGEHILKEEAILKSSKFTEPHKPTQLQINTTFHFGASTRQYILRERSSAGLRNNIMEDITMSENKEGDLLGLPQSQTELDNLTVYNTAYNRRISMLGVTDNNLRKQNSIKNARKRRGVTFNEEEIVISPENIDPNVGRFRNLIRTTVVPTKKLKMDNNIGIPTTSAASISVDMKHLHPSAIAPQLYHGLPAVEHSSNKINSSMDVDVTPIAMGINLGLLLPNPAPDVAPANDLQMPSTSAKAAQFDDHHSIMESSSEP